MSEMQPSKRCERAQVAFDLPQRRMRSVVVRNRKASDRSLVFVDVMDLISTTLVDLAVWQALSQPPRAARFLECACN
jgi:hypothetical protein